MFEHERMFGYHPVRHWLEAHGTRSDNPAFNLARMKVRELMRETTLADWAVVFEWAYAKNALENDHDLKTYQTELHRVLGIKVGQVADLVNERPRVIFEVVMSQRMFEWCGDKLPEVLVLRIMEIIQRGIK